MMISRRLRVLLVAPTIDADDIGEAWVAYQWAKRLSEIHDLTILTYRKRAGSGASEQVPLARVVEWVEPPIFGRAERINSLMKPGYFPFAWKAHRWLKHELANGGHFDVAHQPLPVAMRYPSPLVNVGIPYIIGPVGGGLESPQAFATEDTAPWYVGLRNIDAVRFRLDPLLRASYEQASIVLGIAPYVSEALRSLDVQRIEYLSETGIDSLGSAPQPRIDSGHPLRLLFVGRVIRTKGVRDLVAAMAQLADLDVTADVVGDGFDLEVCRSLASSLGVSDKVRFHGRLERAGVEEFYSRSDVFVFPSFREPGGNVVFEAMRHGLPLIVCDRGGPGAATTDLCAFRLPAESPEKLAASIASAVRCLNDNPELRLQMGYEARRRVESVGLWGSKISIVSSMYHEVAKMGTDIR